MKKNWEKTLLDNGFTPQDIIRIAKDLTDVQTGVNNRTFGHVPIKPYCTKCLPVEEGEIKEGDKWWDGTKVRADYNRNDSFLTSKEIPKAVKLFLCSEQLTAEDYVNLDVPVHIYYDGSQPPFKVLAEISKNALVYVREGQEFQEEQVKWEAHGEDLFNNPVLTQDTYESLISHGYYKAHKEKLRIVATIQCPTCKNFH